MISRHCSLSFLLLAHVTLLGQLGQHEVTERPPRPLQHDLGLSLRGRLGQPLEARRPLPDLDPLRPEVTRHDLEVELLPAPPPRPVEGQVGFEPGVESREVDGGRVGGHDPVVRRDLRPRDDLLEEEVEEPDGFRLPADRLLRSRLFRNSFLSFGLPVNFVRRLCFLRAQATCFIHV